MAEEFPILPPEEQPAAKPPDALPPIRFVPKGRFVPIHSVAWIEEFTAGPDFDEPVAAQPHKPLPRPIPRPPIKPRSPMEGPGHRRANPRRRQDYRQPPRRAA